jgi:hypothetical protein
MHGLSDHTNQAGNPGQYMDVAACVPRYIRKLGRLSTERYYLVAGYDVLLRVRRLDTRFFLPLPERYTTGKIPRGKPQKSCGIPQQ